MQLEGLIEEEGEEDVGEEARKGEDVEEEADKAAEVAKEDTAEEKEARELVVLLSSRRDKWKKNNTKLIQSISFPILCV